MNKGIVSKISNLLISFGAAQFILILATPFLTRLYSPEIFAYFGYVVSFVTVILPLTSFQYEYAIPLLRVKRSIQLLRMLCIYLVLGTSLIIFIISLIFFTQYRDFNVSLTILSLGFIILLLQGLLQIYAMPLIAEGKAVMVGHGKLIQNSAMVTVQIFLPLLFIRSSLGLLIGLVIGLIVNLFYYRLQILKNTFQSKIKLTKRRSFFLLKRYYQLPLFTSWAMLLESASTLMPVLLIGPLYGTKSLGIYFLVYRVFSSPTSLVSAALSKVMLKEIGDRVKQKQAILHLFKKSSFILIIIAFFYLLLMWFISDHISMLFGQAWLESEHVLKILSPIIAITICISPFSALLILLKRSDIDAIWQLFYLFSTILIIYVYRNASFLTMLFYLSGAWVILYIIYWVLMYKVLLNRDKQLCAE